MQTTLNGNSLIVPKKGEGSVAKTLGAQLATEALEVRVLRTGETVALPESASLGLAQILTQLGQGNGFAVMAVQSELTTQQAADLLNVSRPFLVELLDEKKIPFRKVGKHRRVRVEDLMSYKEKTDTDRRKILDALAKEAQELGIGY